MKKKKLHIFHIVPGLQQNDTVRQSRASEWCGILTKEFVQLCKMNPAAKKGEING